MFYEWGSNIRPVLDHDAQGARQKRYSLEIGRFVAAVAVVLFHYTALVGDFTGVLVMDDMFRAGHAGVQYFFVLSGFIILDVHRADFGRGQVGRFAMKRAIRLYPLFWMISLGMLATFLLKPALAGDRTLDAGGVLADLLLLPHRDAILSISWTLRHEMLFYAIFAIALWQGRQWLWLLAPWLAFSLWGSAQHLDVGHLGERSLIGSTLNIGFGLGVLIALRLRAAPLLPTRVALWGGALMLAALCVAEWRVGRMAPHSLMPLGQLGDLAYLGASALLIDGAVRREQMQPIAAPRLWSILGGASYAIYLVHQPLGSLGVRLLAGAGLPPLLLFWLLTAAAVAAAVGLHLWIERPLLRRLRGRMSA